MDIESVFREAGWFPGRRVDVSADLEAYRKQDIDVLPAHAEWLAEFNGLELSRDGESMWLDGCRVASEHTRRFVDDWSEEIGARVLPVGGIADSPILVTDDGAIWETYGANYGLVGATIFEAVYSILNWTPGSGVLLDREHSKWPAENARLKELTLQYNEIRAREKTQRDGGAGSPS